MQAAHSSIIAKQHHLRWVQWAYHMACVGLKVAPPTYWYCATCTHQLQATGIWEPDKDLAFQRYLLHGKLHDEGLRPFFSTLANHCHYEERIHKDHRTSYMQLQRLLGTSWLDYPSPMERTLILEEEHVHLCYVGGVRLHLALCARFW